MTTSRTRGEDHWSGLMAGADRRAVPLLGVDVRAEVVAGHARAVVRQRYRNDETKPVEAIYTFPLPTRASVTGFAMSVDGRSLVGEVHERDEAFRLYDDAVSAGHGSALLEQERPNVFTANVGNLLPGEETVIEIEYVEPVSSDEGAIRWTLPTLVAPRYIPGAAVYDRTAHGTAEPTNRVPDADRISPPIGDAPYGLSLELVFDLDCELDVESPSHEIRSEAVGSRTRVSFTQHGVALDRDIVVTAFPRSSVFAAAPLTSVVAHRAAGAAAGTFAVSLVPDLAGGMSRRDETHDVVFVLDRSGSMEGTSMAEAKTALRLCLRQLREGDRFAVIAFDDRIEMMATSMIPFTPHTLRGADRWIEDVDARGGTEMLEPLLRAAELAPNGVIVLLTDGQVGNEDEIQRQLLARRGAARIYSFGIGTNVSDALLVGLAEKTGGAVALIHPGERVDDKVVAQFARATAPRVTDLKITFRGVEVGEIAPAEPTALVDGEPLTVLGTYEAAGVGAVEIRGTYEGQKFYLEVPLVLPERQERPTLTKLWAQARIRDLERAALTGRRADANKARIVKLAVDHGVSSKYTSFVVVEKRTGDRRVNEQAETRVVPVSAPADWAMFKSKRSRSFGMAMSAGAPPPPPRAMAMAMPMSPAPMPARASAPFAGAPPSPQRRLARSIDRSKGGPGGAPPMDSEADEIAGVLEEEAAYEGSAWASGAEAESVSKPRSSSDPVTATLERQSASGLWEEQGRDSIEVTVEALLVLVRLGVSTSHPVHGAQTKKAVDALLAALEAAPRLDPKLAEIALAALWLVSTGRRTRVAIKNAANGRPGLERLGAMLGRDAEVRAYALSHRVRVLASRP